MATRDTRSCCSCISTNSDALYANTDIPRLHIQVMNLYAKKKLVLRMNDFTNSSDPWHCADLNATTWARAGGANGTVMLPLVFHNDSTECLMKKNY